MLLPLYDMYFIMQEVVEGQAITDFLAEHHIPVSSKLFEDILDKIAEANITFEESVWATVFC